MEKSEFIKLIQSTLNLRHSISLKTDLPLMLQNKKFVFDLADNSKYYFVEIIDSMTPDKRSDIISRLKEVQSKLLNSYTNRNNQIEIKVVSKNDISQREKKFYNDEFKSSNQCRFEFLDRTDILNFCEAFIDDLPHELLIYYKSIKSDIKPSVENKELRNVGKGQEEPVIELPIDSDSKLILGQKIDQNIQYYNILILFVNPNNLEKRSPEEEYISEYFGADSAISSFTNQEIQKGYKWINSITHNLNRHTCIFFKYDEINSLSLDKSIIQSAIKELNNIYGNQFDFFSPNILIICTLGIPSRKDKGFNLVAYYELVSLLRLNLTSPRIRLNLPESITRNQLNNISNDLLSYLKLNKSEFISVEATDNGNIKQSEPILADQGGEDSLNFTKDAQSLAALLALKEMKPPLAIALLGDWGSGKSYFMELLKRQIQMLSRFQDFYESEHLVEPYLNVPKDKPFVEGVAHIYFNAWSYMDANLWAGLAHSMFEKLNAYITDNTKSEIERLKIQVKIAKRLEILHSDLNNYEEKRNQLEKLKQKLKKERDYKILRYLNPKIDAQVKSFLKSSGYDDTDIELLEPSKAYKIVESGINLLTYLKANSYRVTIFLVTSIVSFMILNGLILSIWHAIENPVWIFFSSLWGYLIASVIPISATVLNFYSRRKSALVSLKNIVKIGDEVNSEEYYDENLNIVCREISDLDNIINEVEKSIEFEFSRTSDITQAAISNFISEKQNDKNYLKYLGIITTIRKDFETLSSIFSDIERPSSLLLSENELIRFEDLEKDKNEIAEIFHARNEDGKGLKNKKLERIILYIDDLDRCPDEKVLEVLQAVHLLMAFPLFIVVVGVDERCVQNALLYNQHKKYRGIRNSETIFHTIEPSEYLEKIFQIPFQIPVATESNIQNLVDNLIPTIHNSTSVQEVDESKNEEINQDSLVENDIEANDANYDPIEVEESEPNTDPVEETNFPHEYSGKIERDQIGITSFEKEYLKKLAPFVGRNPRKVKRLVNIFRIVKTHENRGFTNNDDSLKAIVLIALSIGECKNQVVSMFDNVQPEKSLIDFLEESKTTFQELLSIAERDEELHDLLQKSLAEFMPTWNFVKRFSFKMNVPKK